LGDVDSYRCSCGELISQCDFWGNVKLAMAGHGMKFDIRNSRTSLREIPSRYVQRLLKPLVRGPLIETLRGMLLRASATWRRHLSQWQDRNLTLIDCIAKSSGATYVADSSKIGIRLKYLATLDLANVKVVRVIRDGRAVALTHLKPAEFADATDPGLRGGGSGSSFSNRYALPMVAAAREWRRSNEEAEQILRTIPAHDQVCISYEQLCTNPRETMNRIFSFLELPESGEYENFRDVSHHVVGNGMRLDQGNEIRLDDRWREVLSPNELAEFERVAGKLNRSYGYE
jgi:hypothetical protein